MSESNQEYIVISGARENNLKNVSLRIPKRKITIFTGVSGSGKSSIVFDTIAAESTRLLNENFSMFVRNFPAPLSAAGYGRDRESEHGCYCGSEAAGRRFPFHDGHDYRYLSHSPSSLLPSGSALCWTSAHVLV